MTFFPMSRQVLKHIHMARIQEVLPQRRTNIKLVQVTIFGVITLKKQVLVDLLAHAHHLGGQLIIDRILYRAFKW